ncbi:ABC transporter ATP-binding protein [Corynebacterium uterequi]|uniref:ABC-type multidrug transport system, ATPase component n=1 Tax=Corynebacterium uterequi TaxID=1072256 RepID=A0A0G3HGM3_9CORY|nr:ATP-binding cassette domain-containing protein [Corynebacterium uterequi]AKK11910.1 ABC-type multidrug transport system, ATPase component [Corynebacterium uterequi]
MIEVTGLSKTYGRVTAVKDLSLTVRPGTITGFLGPNGSGKSTTMRMIVGLDRPDAGEALINGVPYRKLKQPLRVVGTLLDATAVHPRRSARDHLAWIAHSNGLPAERIDKVLSLVGLVDVQHKKAGGFSLGMSQRLGLGAALLGDPEVLILDEPINGLDPVGIRWMRTLLKQLAGQGRAVLVSSHLLAEMAHTADDLIIIGRGRLLAQTTVHQFTSENTGHRVVARTPDMDRLRDVLARENITAEAGVDADGRAILTISNASSDAVGALAFNAGVQLSELSSYTGSLEDAYLRMTSDAVDYNAQMEA